MATHGDDQSWVARALCASIEPDALFVQGASQRQVRLRCYECEAVSYTHLTLPTKA